MANEYEKAKAHNQTYIDHTSYRTHNLNNDTAVGMIRNVIQKASTPATFQNDRQIAKVIKVEQITVGESSELVTRIMIEIPGREIDGLNESELATDVSKQNSSLYDHRYFYPADSEINDSQVKVGDWVWVKLPPNWPNSHINSDNEGLNSNLYYGKVKGYSNVIEESSASSVKAYVAGLAGGIASAAAGVIGSIFGGTAQTPQTQQQISGQEKYKLAPPQFSITPQDYITSPFPAGVSFVVTSAPVIRKDPIKTIGNQAHMALDFACPVNTPIVAANDGILAYAGFDENAGNLIKILHNNKYYTRYLHLTSFIPRKLGSPIKRGELIGYSGKTGRRVTGPHLHFDVTDIRNNKTNLLYLWSAGNLNLQDGSIITGLPFAAPPQTVVATAEKPAAPVVATSVGNPSPNPNKKTKGSPFSTKPKLTFGKYSPDASLFNKQPNEIGSNLIVLREDVREKIDFIKETLNYYGVALSMQYVDNSLDNPNTSAYAKLGLEVNLNKYSSLNPNNNLNFNDYYVTFNNDNAQYPSLNVWAKVTYNFENEFNGVKPEKTFLDAIDISKTYANKLKPETKKINGYFINVSKLFKEQDLHHVNAGLDFYKYSDYSKSNWWVFYSHEKLYKNATYIELLESLYELSDSEKIIANNIIWNGKDFV